MYGCYTTLGNSQLHSDNFSNQSYTLTLHKIKKNIDFIHTTVGRCFVLLVQWWCGTLAMPL